METQAWNDIVHDAADFAASQISGAPIRPTRASLSAAYAADLCAQLLALGQSPAWWMWHANYPLDVLRDAHTGAGTVQAIQTVRSTCAQLSVDVRLVWAVNGTGLGHASYLTQTVRARLGGWAPVAFSIVTISLVVVFSYGRAGRFTALSGGSGPGSGRAGRPSLARRCPCPNR